LVQRVEAAKNGERTQEMTKVDLQQGKRISPLIDIPAHIKQAMQHQAAHEHEQGRGMER
jgi:hypothetical protein